MGLNLRFFVSMSTENFPKVTNILRSRATAPLQEKSVLSGSPSSLSFQSRTTSHEALTFRRKPPTPPKPCLLLPEVEIKRSSPHPPKKKGIRPHRHPNRSVEKRHDSNPSLTSQKHLNPPSLKDLLPIRRFSGAFMPLISKTDEPLHPRPDY